MKNSIYFYLILMWSFSYIQAQELNRLEGSSNTLPLDPRSFTSADDKVYFVAADSTHGEELWQYREGEVSFVVDVYTGSQGSDIGNLVYQEPYLYFSAENEENGEELFFLNTRTNELSILDIEAGTTSSSPNDLLAIPNQNRIVFTAFSNTHGREIYSLNSSGQFERITDIANGPANSNPKHLYYIPSQNQLIYQAFQPDYGTEVWTTTLGASVTTTLLEDIVPGSVGSDPTNFIGDEDVYFTYSEDGHQYLARYDANQNFKRIQSPFFENNQIKELRLMTEDLLGTTLLFMVNQAQSNDLLVYTDLLDTVQLYNFKNSNQRYSNFNQLLTSSDGLLFFDAFVVDSSSVLDSLHRELLVVDPFGKTLPINSGTAVVLSAFQSPSPNIDQLTYEPLDQYIYFTASVPAVGQELFRLGIEQRNTRPTLLTDIASDTLSSHIENLVHIDKQLFFSAQSNPNGSQHGYTFEEFGQVQVSDLSNNSIVRNNDTILLPIPNLPYESQLSFVVNKRNFSSTIALNEIIAKGFGYSVSNENGTLRRLENNTLPFELTLNLSEETLGEVQLILNYSTIDTFAFFVKPMLHSSTSNAWKNEFYCWPNPARDILNVQHPLGSQLKIFNMQSQLVQTIRSAQTLPLKIDLRKWPDGIYFISDGLNTRKVVKNSGGF